jgi:hypothetical protein
MVSVLRELLAVLAALYLIDCLTVIRRGQRLLCSWMGGDVRVRRPGPTLAGLLPLDQAFAVSRRGLVATADSLHLPPEQETRAAAYREASWTAVSYEDAAQLTTAGRELRFGAGGRGARLRRASAAEARAVAVLVGELVALRPEERAGHAAAWSARALDPERLTARHRAFETAVTPLVSLGLALFCCLHLALPPMVYLGMPPPLLPEVLLGTAALLWAATAALAARVARRLRQDGHIGGDGALTAICLSLPSATRAALHLGFDLLYDCDFCAAAAVLLERPAALAVLRAELHGATRAVQGGPGWQSFWNQRHAHLAPLLRHLNVSEEEILTPPPCRGPQAAGYCPLCDGEFPPGQGRCANCGTPLLHYPPVPGCLQE